MMKRNKTVVCRLAGWAIVISIALMVSGCGELLVQKSEEMQARAILDELGQVRESPHIDNPLPEMYRQEATRLEIKDGVKLFYFTHHHPADDLATLIKERLSVESATNTATNQLVAFCKDDAQADVVEQYLEMIDIPPVQVNVDCLILERYGDVTMDWESTLTVENLFGEGITFDAVFPGASLRETERSNFGLDLGYWINKGVDGHQVNATVDMLVSHGYLKILLNPQLETVNGQEATVTIKDYVPTEQVKTGESDVAAYTITEYTWVENTLKVTPQVYSDGSIGLATDITIGSRSKPDGVVQRNIITARTVSIEENRVLPGKSLVIGGMRKNEKRSVVRGIPFLMDLPLLGVLFSSKDFEEKGTEIIFILTPSISSGGVENVEMVRDVRRKYNEPKFDRGPLGEIIAPFTGDGYTGILEREATEAELSRIQAEMDLEQAQTEVQTEKTKAQEAIERAKALKEKAAQLQKTAEQAQTEAKKAAEALEKIKSQTQTEQEKISQLEQQKQQSLQTAEQARQQADEAIRQSAQAAEQAQKLQKQAQEAQLQLEKAKQAAEEAKKQAEEEAKRRAEEEAKRLAEQKAAEEEARRKAEAEKDRQPDQPPSETTPVEQQ